MGILVSMMRVYFNWGVVVTCLRINMKGNLFLSGNHLV